MLMEGDEWKVRREHIPAARVAARMLKVWMAGVRFEDKNGVVIWKVRSGTSCDCEPFTWVSKEMDVVGEQYCKLVASISSGLDEFNALYISHNPRLHFARNGITAV
jgi:hypothetical protein